MKRLFAGLVLMFCAGLIYAVPQPVQTHDDFGAEGCTYEMWITSGPFEVISSTYADIITDWTIEAVSNDRDLWYDFDSTVSTGCYNASNTKGYITGSNARLKAGDWMSSKGRIGLPVFMRTDLQVGTTISVTIVFRQYSLPARRGED